MWRPSVKNENEPKADGTEDMLNSMQQVTENRQLEYDHPYTKQLQYKLLF